MVESSLEEIIIRLRLILALLKTNEFIQAVEYLEILTEKYGMNDLATIKKYINSNEINSALLMVEQAINSYENIGLINKTEIPIVHNRQVSIEIQFLIPFKNNDKWGFKDLNNNIIIECLYESAWEFHEGKAGVKKNGKYGFINTRGEDCSDFIYDDVRPYSDGMAAVMITSQSEYDIFQNQKSYFSKWGVINHDGQLIVPIIYSNVPRFSEGLALVKTLTNYYEGMQWHETKYKFAFIDKSGAEIIQLNNFSDSSSGPIDWLGYHEKPNIFKENRCKISTNYIPGSNRLYGRDLIIDRNGNVIVSNLKYDLMNTYSEGLSAVAIANKHFDSDGESYHSFKWGFIDINGNEVINCRFEDAGSFKDGFAPVKLNGKWGFINKKGFITISCQYEALRPFSEGLAAAYQEMTNVELDINHKTYKWGFIDERGKTVIPFIYEAYTLSYETFIPGCDSFKNGRVRVEKGDKYFVIDKNGDIIE